LIYFRRVDYGGLKFWRTLYISRININLASKKENRLRADYICDDSVKRIHNNHEKMLL